VYVGKKQDTENYTDKSHFTVLALQACSHLSAARETKLLIPTL